MKKIKYAIWLIIAGSLGGCAIYEDALSTCPKTWIVYLLDPEGGRQGVVGFNCKVVNNEYMCERPSGGTVRISEDWERDRNDPNWIKKYAVEDDYYCVPPKPWLLRYEPAPSTDPDGGRVGFSTWTTRSTDPTY